MTVQAKLEEPLVIRPTSETIIWTMFRKWIDSYRCAYLAASFEETGAVQDFLFAVFLFPLVLLPGEFSWRRAASGTPLHHLGVVRLSRESRLVVSFYVDARPTVGRLGDRGIDLPNPSRAQP